MIFSRSLLADVAGVITCLRDLYRVLKALEILLRQGKRRFGKLHIDESAGNAEGKAALTVCDQRSRLRRDVPGGPQPVLPLLSPLKQVADAQVELRCVVEVILTELARLKNRQKLPIAQYHRVGTQVRSDLFRFALLDGGARGEEIVVVPERHLNGVIQRNGHRCRILSQRLSRG